MTVLLPHTSRLDAVSRRLSLTPQCIGNRGKNVFEIEGATSQACPGFERWSKAELWWLLLSDPQGLLAALGDIPGMLLPWRPASLGVVEGRNYGDPPPWAKGLGDLFPRSAATAALILVLPVPVLVLTLLLARDRIARGVAGVCVAGSLGVAGVALFGDGHADHAKHAHLAISFALASLCIPAARIVALLADRLPRLSGERASPSSTPEVSPGSEGDAREDRAASAAS